LKDCTPSLTIKQLGCPPWSTEHESNRTKTHDSYTTPRDAIAYDPNRDWFLQNVRLMQALTKKGYDVNYSWGIGVHSHNMGGAMLPEMMRWLWRDQPVSLDPLDTAERSFRASK
jgi:hypothetical protein